jgi:alginate O-acetyltransferase complex protein AlgI
MIFASGVFLYYFLPLFLLLYYLSPRDFRSYVIAFASYVFYGWWRPDFVLLMLVSTVVDYSCGKQIVKGREKGHSGRRWVVVSAVVNLSLLGYFKYANFGIDSINHVLDLFEITRISWPKIVLPIGISFYTFQTMSYTIDVYRGTSPPVRNLRDFMCYVALFPQLIAGPIVRYNTIADQLHSRTHTLGKFYQGVLFFQIGFAKKVLIADTLAPIAEDAFRIVELSTFDSWIGVLAFAFQLFFDFSGYSDMAIGLGLMMGFRFPINFNKPYRAISITDIWQRWHISLSAFLRDYLYIPLGGNKKGPVRTYFNLIVTMLLCGLWHGAAWSYVMFGVYQGFWLILERQIGKKALYAKAPRIVQVALTFVIWLFGLAIFMCPTVRSGFAYVGTMAGFHLYSPSSISLIVKPIHISVGAIAAALVWFAPASHEVVPKARLTFALALQVLFLLALVHLHYQDHIPFIYYQF